MLNEETVNLAKHNISLAAQDAVRVVASAAAEAAKVIANSAAEANKINSLQQSSDHDILIELKTKMVDLKSDIKEIKDGTSGKLNNHEARLAFLENIKSGQDEKDKSYLGTLKLLIVIGILLISLMVWHLTGYKI